MSLAERIKLFIHIRNLGKSETWLSDYLMLANFHNAPGSYKLEYNRSLAKTDDPDRNIDRFEVNGTLIDDPKTIAYK